MDIQNLCDRAEIQDFLSKYARAVDTGDWKLWRSLFTEDAAIDYTPLGGIAGTRDEVVEYMSATMPMLPMKQHFITNIEIDFSEDAAEVIAMFYNPMRLPGSTELSVCGGWYRHQLIRTSTGWRSTNLREENTWFAAARPAADSDPVTSAAIHDEGVR